jgi:soluble lytic murein transglycosylase-like protein
MKVFAKYLLTGLFGLGMLLTVAAQCFAPVQQGTAGEGEAASLNGTLGISELFPAGSKESQSIDLKTLCKYADEFGVDPRLVVAMIRQESRFDAHAVSNRGAQGLMQIMPVTSLELTDELDLLDPTHPSQNLRAGTYYFSKLFDLFNSSSLEDRICLALAAYNAGPSRIYDAQELAAYMGEDPSKWSSVAQMLPLLSKRYYSLHAAVWGSSRPPSGYYGSWRQTVSYVQHITDSYKTYRSASADGNRG